MSFSWICICPASTVSPRAGVFAVAYKDIEPESLIEIVRAAGARGSSTTVSHERRG